MTRPQYAQRQHQQQSDILEYAATETFGWVTLFIPLTLFAFVVQTPNTKANSKSSGSNEADRIVAREATQNWAEGKAGEGKREGERGKNAVPIYPEHDDERREIQGKSSDEKKENDEEGYEDGNKPPQSSTKETQTSPRYTIFLHPYLSPTTFKTLAITCYSILFGLLVLETWWVMMTFYRAIKLFFSLSFPLSRPIWSEQPVLNVTMSMMFGLLVGVGLLLLVVVAGVVVLACLVTCCYPFGCVAEVLAFDKDMGKEVGGEMRGEGGGGGKGDGEEEGGGEDEDDGDVT